MRKLKPVFALLLVALLFQGMLASGEEIDPLSQSVTDDETKIASWRLFADSIYATSDAEMDEGTKGIVEKLKAWMDEKYATFGYERDDVSMFMEVVVGYPTGTFDYAPVASKPCAHYVLTPKFFACRTGIDNDQMLSFSKYDSQYDDANNLVSRNAHVFTDAEIWGTFGKLYRYIIDAESLIFASGFQHGANSTECIIEMITTDGGYYYATLDALSKKVEFELVE